MDKMTFASYKFKPSDVIEGLNRYFAESKANRYRRVPLEIWNGVWTSNPDYRKDIVFINSYSDASVTTKASGSSWKYYLICDVEEVVGVAINWLREEHDIFYTPGMEVPGEDRDIFCMGNLKAPVEDFYVDEAAKEYEKATRKDLKEALQRRLHEAKKRIAALEEGHAEKTKIIDRQKTMIKDLEEQLREKTEENSVLRGNLDYFADLAQKRQMELSNLRYEILKVYREIFDCSTGDPEGSDEETIQDILTEYQRVLKLKDVAEEKAIKWKEIALENEEKADKYKKLNRELDRYKWLYENLKNGVESVLQEAEEKED